MGLSTRHAPLSRDSPTPGRWNLGAAGPVPHLAKYLGVSSSLPDAAGRCPDSRRPVQFGRMVRLTE